MVKITEKYYLETDRYNWTLWEKHIVTEKEAKKSKRSNAGDVMYRNPTYHSKLENLLNYLLERRQKDMSKDCKNINELVDRITKMKNEFTEDLKKILEENKNEI